MANAEAHQKHTLAAVRFFRVRGRDRVATAGIQSDQAARSDPTKDVMYQLANLTRNQFLIWTGHQISSQLSIYNEVVTFTIEGTVDRHHFERAVAAVVERTDSLRTVFREEGGLPRLQVLDRMAYDLAHVDLSDEQDPQAELDAWVAAHAAMPLDLTRRCFETALLKIDDDRFVWYLLQHHVNTDATSIAILFRRVGECYARSIAGTLESLGAYPEFREYVAFEQQRRGTTRYAKCESYWSRKLAEPSDPVVPLNDSGGDVPSARAHERIRVELGRDLSDRIRLLAGHDDVRAVSQDLSIFSIFAAVLFSYLHRISGSERIAIGTPWQNRPKRFSDTVGLLMEQDPFHVAFDADESFGSLIRKVQAEALEVMRHLPYAAGNPGGQAYTVVLNYLKASIETFAGMPARAVWSHSGGGDGSMIVNVQDFQAVKGFTLEFDFDCAVFRPEVRGPAVRHFMNLLAACLADPWVEIRSAEMLDGQERDQLTVGWNGTASPYCQDACLPQLIEAQVRLTPDATALIAGHQRLSYQAMNARANVLAHELRSLHVGVDDIVAVCVPRGLALPIALLAVMKAGAAYLPLDPDYPPDRLAFMLEDAAVGVLLTDVATRRDVFGDARFAGIRFICVDRQSSEPPVDAQANLPPLAGAGNLAYVIYTSGSTGMPKGVMIEHRGLVNNIAWQIREFGFNARDRVLQWTSVAFDAAIWELWTPLCVGAAQVISELQDARDPKATLELIRRESITFAQTVPTFLSAMLTEMERPAEPLPLRLFVVGGEALPARDARRWSELCDVELVNMYGPTECTVDACYLRHAGEAACKTLSIGRPIANTRVYSLDAWMQPLPVGVAGELYIGGDGIARGYLNRPDLTAERFVPDPFSAQPGARLYRTGDRGRFLPDGRIEFLGRTDSQVKVRGYRVELGEIEATLARHPGVDQCVVCAREDRPGDVGIVAYVVPKAQAPAGASLREHLQERLPAHMVPRHIVALDAIPVLPNGKINRNALPAPGVEGESRAGGYVAPAPGTEAALAAIWQEVLGVRQVGATDSFFELGGHSMLAMQAISRINAAMGVELPLRSLFERPTVSGLSAEVQDALLRVGKVIREEIPGTDPGTPATLSFAQEGLWFIDRMLGPSSLYNIAQATRIRGGLDIEALRQALQALVERHTALRTAIEERDGVPVQVVAPALVFDVPVVDVPGTTVEAREAALAELLGEATSQPFALNQAPLFQARLLRLGQHDHVLQMVMHHIVTDGWSVGVINRELKALYEASLMDGRGIVPALPAPPVQFRDYAAWQRARMQGDRLERLLGYWRAKLSGLERLVLPADQPQAAGMSTAGRMIRADIPAQSLERLQALAHEEGATVFMVLLAAFKLLMMRYSGQDDVAVGSPVTGRGRDDLDGIVGLLINSIVLRTDLSGAPSFRQLLGRVRQTALDAYAHQELPFETLVADLSPQRTLSGNPLFDVLINHIIDDQAQLGFPGCESTDIETAAAESKFSLTLYVVTRERGATLRLVYRRDLFSQEWGSACLAHYLALLEQVGEAPDRVLSDYSLRGREPRWLPSDPTLPMPAHPREPVTARIVAQARATPDALAVTSGGRTWTYSQFMGHAQATARKLVEDGAGRGNVIAIMGPRSPGVVCAMLAVLLAGGVFLTIDQELPAERKRTMLLEARASMLLHVVEAGEWEGPGFRSGLDLADQVRVIRIGSMLDEMGAAETSEDVPLPSIAGEDAAYVFFTSGSTGQPKAVLGCHRGLSQFLEWQRHKFGVGAGDRVSQLVAMSFDPMLRDVFLPLTSGATLCLPREADLFDVPGWLRRERITVVHTTPSLVQAWLSEVEEPAPLEALRWLFISGEPLTGVLVSRWRDRFGSSCGIVNLYGPTETTMARCFYEVPDEVQAGVQPIGAPIPDTQVLLLGTTGRLCGVNEPGEIAIRTPFRSLGYMNLPEETARRFMQNPFTDEAGDLIYRTGDRGRCRPDGLLEFIGRIDDQVKIRGVRVEPAEVSAVLARHPGVATCAVLAHGAAGGGSELIAYVVRVGGDSTDSRQLRAFLKAHLPSALVPASFVFLDTMPLLANGKVDRSALGPPHLEARQADYAAPRTPVEAMLLDIWTDLLESPRIGINDDFFDLGGHSLTATRIVSRIRSTFAVDLPLRAIFESPTITELSAIVTGMRRAASTRGMQTQHSIVRCERGTRLAVSFSQRRMWLLQALDPATTAYNMPLTLRLQGRLDREALFTSLRLLAERHESFRTTIVMDGDEPVQIVGGAAPLEPEVLDLSNWPAGSVEGKARQMLDVRAQTPFDLATGPLHRICLVVLGPADHLLMILMHHAVSDDWSSGILLREVKTAYHAVRHGLAVDLPPLAIQPADHATWQRERFGVSELDTQYMFWRKRLRGVAELALPIDLPMPMIRSWVGARVQSRISQETLKHLREFSRTQAATPYMTLLACFQILLSKYCGQEDIVVGAPIANRTTLESEMLVGTLVNTLVMRSCVSPASTFSAFLEKLVPDVLDCYDNQDIPFDYLVERFRSDPELEPLNVRVLFNVLNTPWETPQLDGLVCSLFDVSRGAAQFDLSLSIDLDITCSATLAFTTDIFDPATARRLLDNFMHLVEQVLANPDRCIKEYEIVSPSERSQLAAWNETAVDYPRDRLVTDLIVEQVRRRGASTALVSQAGLLSYEELLRRSNQLAQVLRARGAGRGRLVGLCLERGADMVIAQLAVLMSGAGYVPLDPGFPKDRLAYMAADSKLALLVTQSSLAHVVTWPADQTLMLDTAVVETARQPVALLPVDEQSARPEDPAYVIYTSGSTGRPKGVMVPHRAVVNFLATMARQPGLVPGDRLVAVTTLSFDIAVLELLLPLSVGAQVVLASAERAADGFALRVLLEESAANVMQATPGTWRLLIAAGWKGSRRFKALVGGEPLPVDLAEQLADRTAEVWNMYGPTETTVWSTCWRVENPVAGISIGRPIGNTKVWIRDTHGRLCPIGVAGEICISGDGVALGYLDRPELTADRFVPDDSGPEPGARLYRTGDLGRWRADGTLEHLGRLDYQVKVRGYRIELGEIETALAAHPAVAQCVALAREDVPGDVRLVAYVVPATEMPSAAAMREFLGATLPDYMVPQQFVVIQAVPLLPNGKIDRSSLPAPDHDAARFDGHHVEPATALEILIAEIWCSLLGVTRISKTDNFFELGGHSLLAMRAVVAVQERAGIRIEPRRFIFETLGQLASSADSPPQVEVARSPNEDAVTRVVRLLSRVAGAKRRP